MNRKINILFAFILIALVASGCATSFSGRSPTTVQYRIKGQVKNGIYYSPDKKFSCPLPEFVAAGTAVIDKSDVVQGGIMGTVGFDGAEGDLYRIEWFEITPEQQAKLKETQMQRVLLEAARAYELNMFRSFSPKVTIEYEETTGEDVQAKKFFILYASEAANIGNNAKRYDSTRGFLIFIKGNWVYALSIQDTASFNSQSETPEARNTKLKAELEKFSKTINFN